MVSIYNNQFSNLNPPSTPSSIHGEILATRLAEAWWDRTGPTVLDQISVIYGLIRVTVWTNCCTHTTDTVSRMPDNITRNISCFNPASSFKGEITERFLVRSL